MTTAQLSHSYTPSCQSQWESRGKAELFSLITQVTQTQLSEMPALATSLTSPSSDRGHQAFVQDLKGGLCAWDGFQQQWRFPAGKWRRNTLVPSPFSLAEFTHGRQRRVGESLWLRKLRELHGSFCSKRAPAGCRRNPSKCLKSRLTWDNW